MWGFLFFFSITHTHWLFQKPTAGTAMLSKYFFKQYSQCIILKWILQVTSSPFSDILLFSVCHWHAACKHTGYKKRKKKMPDRIKSNPERHISACFNCFDQVTVGGFIALQVGKSVWTKVVFTSANGDNIICRIFYFIVSRKMISSNSRAASLLHSNLWGWLGHRGIMEVCKSAAPGGLDEAAQNHNILYLCRNGLNLFVLFAETCVIATQHSTTSTIECSLKVLWNYTFNSKEKKNGHLATWSVSGFSLP